MNKLLNVTMKLNVMNIQLKPVKVVDKLLNQSAKTNGQRVETN